MVEDGALRRWCAVGARVVRRVIRLPTPVALPAGRAGDFVLVLVILVVKTLLVGLLRSANQETSVVRDPLGASPPVTRPLPAKRVARTRALSATSTNIVVMARAIQWELSAVQLGRSPAEIWAVFREIGFVASRCRIPALSFSVLMIR